MDSIVSIPSKIVKWLSEQKDMKDLTFFTEYPPIKKAVPLKKPIIAVGIENIEITDKFVANDDGVLEKQEYCRSAQIKASLHICVPFDMGGSACHDIFTRITNALTFRTNLNIVQSDCDEINSDRDTDALVMTGRFLMNTDFCPAESTDESYECFLDKELLCGSHIRNADIHVTPSDKGKWNEPYVTGFYFGNGSSSRTVDVGFKPNFVMIAASGYPAVGVDFAGGVAREYFGFANSNYGTIGISVTSSGFKVSTATGSGVNAAMNQTGVSYVFIAFK